MLYMHVYCRCGHSGAVPIENYFSAELDALRARLRCSACSAHGQRWDVRLAWHVPVGNMGPPRGGDREAG
ncbi:hypothetical protein [Mangrovicoccus algicola]|uniref:Uncharacterized protein n=1 Tax=Mangrovicoccus algicola TaxID=2771008 RepID=A0A8J7CZ70_9RHOB|nr:hypothetical protein [Mangrovicoccus algicola]MBE3637453.1 hypothetical protein [Mangrovicoccus algicola]